MTQTPNNLAAYIWSLADLLRGDFKQSQYGRIILPFTLLRRLECVLEDSKESVLAQVEKVQAMNVSEEAQEKLLLRATIRWFVAILTPSDQQVTRCSGRWFSHRHYSQRLTIVYRWCGFWRIGNPSLHLRSGFTGSDCRLANRYVLQHRYLHLYLDIVQ